MPKKGKSGRFRGVLDRMIDHVEDFRGAGGYEEDEWNLFDPDALYPWPVIVSLGCWIL